MTTPDDILLRRALAIVPMVLGQLDRNPLSPTHGHFGRRHWAWKATPFADSTNQYAVGFLAAVWALDHPDNPWHQKPELARWIAAGLERWCGLQHRDGSFDQALINEHGYGPTAYTVLAVLDALAAMPEAFTIAVRARVDAALRRAGEFLARNWEEHGVVSNHEALFAVCCRRLGDYLGDTRLRAKAHGHLDRILAHASAEGWFLEYEGADPGYQTQCLSYLALLRDMGHPGLDRAIRAAVEFLALFVHPDGTLGGHHGCRNTTVVYPAGLALLAGEMPMAQSILDAVAEAVAGGRTPAPDSVDFENSFRLGANYLAAWRALAGRPEAAAPPPLLPWRDDARHQWLPQAGLLVHVTPAYMAVASLRKGGVLRVFDKSSRALAFEDRGYRAEIDGRMAATAFHRSPEIVEADGALTVRQRFHRVRQAQVTPVSTLALVVLGLTAFRFRRLREAFKRLLVRLLITGAPEAGATLERTLAFAPGAIRVTDRVRPDAGRTMRSLVGRELSSAIHMASADFLDPVPALGQENVQVLRLGSAGVDIATQVTFGPDGRPKVTTTISPRTPQ